MRRVQERAGACRSVQKGAGMYGRQDWAGVYKSEKEGAGRCRRVQGKARGARVCRIVQKYAKVRRNLQQCAKYAEILH